nr:immunoglobulin light chain junction region [Macaca mulatta]MPO11441.1 immunoglobulin light chain junction region [Macaca mulatta]MPO11821.1 immunoglobulin light chain junction region [Macaca mulatta]
CAAWDDSLSGYMF